MAQLNTEDPKLGCPQDDKRAEAFLEITRYLEENDDEQITIKDHLNDPKKPKLADIKYGAYNSYLYMKKLQREN